MFLLLRIFHLFHVHVCSSIHCWVCSNFISNFILSFRVFYWDSCWVLPCSSRLLISRKPANNAWKQHLTFYSLLFSFKKSVGVWSLVQNMLFCYVCLTVCFLHFTVPAIQEALHLAFLFPLFGIAQSRQKQYSFIWALTMMHGTNRGNTFQVLPLKAIFP